MRTWVEQRLNGWRSDLLIVGCRMHVLLVVIRSPAVPWHAKVIAGSALGYVFSPIQLIPTFIPVVGQLDDLFILFLGMKCLRRLVAAEVLGRCEREAELWREQNGKKLKAALRKVKSYPFLAKLHSAEVPQA